MRHYPYLPAACLVACADVRGIRNSSDFCNYFIIIWPLYDFWSRDRRHVFDPRPRLSHHWVPSGLCRYTTSCANCALVFYRIWKCPPGKAGRRAGDKAADVGKVRHTFASSKWPELAQQSKEHLHAKPERDVYQHGDADGGYEKCRYYRKDVGPWIHHKVRT